MSLRKQRHQRQYEIYAATPDAASISPQAEVNRAHPLLVPLAIFFAVVGVVMIFMTIILYSEGLLFSISNHKSPKQKLDELAISWSDERLFGRRTPFIGLVEELTHLHQLATEFGLLGSRESRLRTQASIAASHILRQSGSQFSPAEMQALAGNEAFVFEGPHTTTEIVEAAGLLRTLNDLVTKLGVSSQVPHIRVTPGWLVDLHRQLFPLRPEIAGQLRTTEINGTTEHPPPPIVGHLVLRLTTWLQASMSQNGLGSGHSVEVDAVELAARAYYAVWLVAPYEEGNLRLASLVMNAVLLRAGYPPVGFEPSVQQEYEEGLRQMETKANGTQLVLLLIKLLTQSMK